MVAPRSVSSGDPLDDALVRVADGVFVRETDEEKDLLGTDVPRARAADGVSDACARAIDRCALKRECVRARATANASTRDEECGAGKDREEGQRKMDPLGTVVLHERMRARSSRERRDGDDACVLESSVSGSASASSMELADDDAIIPFPPVGKVFSRLVDAVDERADEVVIHTVRGRRNLRWVGV